MRIEYTKCFLRINTQIIFTAVTITTQILSEVTTAKKYIIIIIIIIYLGHLLTRSGLT